MKLRVFDRILLAILLIVAILASLVLLAVSAGLVTLEMCTDFIRLFYDVRENAWILAGSGLFILLISIKLLFCGRSQKKVIAPETISIRQSAREDGTDGAYISLSAIDSMVTRFCEDFSGVKNCSTNVKTSAKGVSIGVKTTVSDGTDITLLTAQLQSGMREHIQSLTGIVVEDINILVDCVERPVSTSLQTL